MSETTLFPDRGYEIQDNITQDALRGLLGKEYDKVKDPENIRLSDAEKIELIDFERKLLFGHEIEPSTTKLWEFDHENMSLLERLKAFSVDSSTFYLNFFLTEQGQDQLRTLYLPHFDTLEQAMEIARNADIIIEPDLIANGTKLKPDARIILAKTLNLAEDMPSFKNIEDVQQYIYNLDWKKVDKNNKEKILSKVEKASTDYFDDFMHKILLEYIEETDESKRKEIKKKSLGQRKVTLVHHPLEQWSYVSALRSLKAHYMTQARQLKNSPHDVDNLYIAKKLVLETHRQSINIMIANSEGDTAALVDEYLSFKDNKNITPSITGQRKLEVARTVRFMPSSLGTSIRGGLLARKDKLIERIHSLQSWRIALMDRYIHGAGRTRNNYGSKTIPSPISQKLERFVLSVSSEAGEKRISDKLLSKLQQIFTVENIDQQNFFELLENYTIDVLQFEQIANRVLQKLDILSEEPYDPDNKQVSEDKKIRVYPKSKNRALSVNTQYLTINVPEDYNKPLKNFLYILAHELQHGVQAVNAIRNVFNLNGKLQNLRTLNSIRPPRGILSSEGGALNVQRQTLRNLTNEVNPVSLAYFKAVEQRLKGGDFFDSAVAFFNQFTSEREEEESSKDLTTKDNAIRAVSRTRRIFRGMSNLDDRSGVVTWTKDLNYLESNILAEVIGDDTNLTSMLDLSGSNPRFFALFDSLGLINREGFVKIPEGYANLGELVIATTFEVLF